MRLSCSQVRTLIYQKTDRFKPERCSSSQRICGLTAGQEALNGDPVLPSGQKLRDFCSVPTHLMKNSGLETVVLPVGVLFWKCISSKCRAERIAMRANAGEFINLIRLRHKLWQQRGTSLRGDGHISVGWSQIPFGYVSGIWCGINVPLCWVWGGKMTLE